MGDNFKHLADTNLNLSSQITGAPPIPQRRTGDDFSQTIVTFSEMLGTTGDPKNGVCLDTLLSPSLPHLGCLWQLFSELLTAVYIATLFASRRQSLLSSWISIPQP